MTENRIAIFGIGSSLGKKVVPLLTNSYDKVRVVTRRDEIHFERVLSEGRGNVIARGHYYLDKDIVMQSMEGCRQVMLALPRYLNRHEVMQYGKFIGECTAAAKIPTIVLLETAEDSIIEYPSSLEDAFSTLDSYLNNNLNLEVVRIHANSIVSGRWERKERYEKPISFHNPLTIFALFQDKVNGYYHKALPRGLSYTN